MPRQKEYEESLLLRLPAGTIAALDKMREAKTRSELIRSIFDKAISSYKRKK